MSRNSGRLVETKSGKLGRTFNSKGIINGKIPVYVATKIEEMNGLKYPVAFAEQAILCDPSSLTIKGYID